MPADLTLERVARIARRVRRASSCSWRPCVSAIKQDGVALYERVRRGEDVVAPERRCVLHAIEVLAVRGDEIDLARALGKGFYVRSLGRDLAAALGTVGHSDRFAPRDEQRILSVPVAAGCAAPRSATTMQRCASRWLRARLAAGGSATDGTTLSRSTRRASSHARHGRAIASSRVIAGSRARREQVEPVLVLDAQAMPRWSLARARAGQLRASCVV